MEPRQAAAGGQGGPRVGEEESADWEGGAAAPAVAEVQRGRRARRSAIPLHADAATSPHQHRPSGCAMLRMTGTQLASC